MRLGASSIMNKYGRKHNVKMISPYRKDTKLDRIFRFMQDGCWHTLDSITMRAYYHNQITPMKRWRVQESRTASALRTIRSHPDLQVRYNGEQYRMELFNPYRDLVRPL